MKPFILLTVTTVVLALATVAEKLWGTEFAQTHIYGSWWFVALWFAVAATALYHIFRKKLYRKPAVFLQHIAFVVILGGALVTFSCAKRGYMHLRQGEVVTTWYDLEETNHPLPFDVKLLLFDIKYHPNSDEPADYISYIRFDTTVCQVSMNRIGKFRNYRFYQADFDEDEMGSYLLVNCDPWGTGITYSGYLLLALTMLWVLFQKMGYRKALYALAIAATVWACFTQIKVMTPVLRSPLLSIHVSVIVCAYLGLLTIAVCSAAALLKPVWSEKLFNTGKLLLTPSLFFLMAGIFIGAVWANISWGRYWGWDAKETWALITLLVYCLPLHSRSLKWFATPKHFHAYCTIAFLTVLMTFLGVSFLLGGMHGYLNG